MSEPTDENKAMFGMGLAAGVLLALGGLLKIVTAARQAASEGADGQQ